MNVRFNAVAIIPILAVFGALSLLGGYSRGQTELDPVPSLSYLKATLELTPVALEGGEELEIYPGRGLVLLDGSARLVIPGNVEFWIVDVTAGDVLTADVEMEPGHLYFPVTSDPDAVVIIRSIRETVIAVPGGVAVE